MKKLFCIILALTTVFLFSGCGKDNQVSDDGVKVSTYNRLRLSPAPEFGFEDFEGKDSEGNSVNESVFADYNLTLINCWTTWCPYCIQEMPALNELYGELPENVNLMSICHDSTEAPEDFEAILKEIPHEFTVIAADDKFNEQIGAFNITGFPTTLFADKTGKIIGQIAGLPLSDTSTGVDGTIKDGYKKLIDDALVIINEGKN